MVTSDKKRVALFGGAFDPPHIGHALAITSLLNSPIVDEVWVVPSGQRSDKEYSSNLSSRLSMVDLFIREIFPREPRIKIDQIECSGLINVPLGTYELWNVLTTLHPTCEFLVVIGNELIKDLPSWRHAEELKTKVRFLVLGREAEIPEDGSGYAIECIDMILRIGVSSTLIRQLASEGKGINGLVSAGIAELIKERGLYR